MKKLFTALLTAALLCSMLAVFTIPAFANEVNPTSYTGYGEIPTGAYSTFRVTQTSYINQGTTVALHDSKVIISAPLHISGHMVGTISNSMVGYNKIILEKGGCLQVTLTGDASENDIANIYGYFHTNGNTCTIYYDAKAKGKTITVISNETDSTASVFSNGTLWIITGVVLVAAMTTVVIFAVLKKKKKPATADGAAEDTEE